MNIKLRLATTLMLGSLFAQPVGAQDGPKQLTVEQAVGIVKTLKPEQGQIKLDTAHATLDLGKTYDFYGPADAKRIIVEVWGNPPSSGENLLGLIMEHGKSPVSDAWGAIVSYEASGYVADDDAATTDYNDLLDQLKEGTEAGNEDRKSQGYPALHVVGWAENPHYDKTSHSIVWARNLKFDDSAVNSLNYDLRSLGRGGVLSVNFLSAMPQLGSIKSAATAFASHSSFDKGFRYSDFDPNLDKKAEYGIGGLVAAGLGLAVAKKLGFLAILLKFIKPLIFAVVAGFAVFKNKVLGLFGGKKGPLEGE